MIQYRGGKTGNESKEKKRQYVFGEGHSSAAYCGGGYYIFGFIRNVYVLGFNWVEQAVASF